MESDKPINPAGAGPANDREALKRAAAERAASYVQSGMAVGMGTGSTAYYMIAALIRRVREEGLRIVGVPTSERSAQQARAGGLTLTDLGCHPTLDLTIDGADQVERGSLNLIKGMGGALLREKIVATASRRLVIVVDDGKLCDRFSLAVPVEVAQFGWQATRRHIEAVGAATTLRLGADGAPYLTDGGNFILDCHMPDGQGGAAADVGARDRALREIVGVIETGYFIGRADEVLVAGAGGVERLVRG
jgi:ribose 5-phosphate isomerase A